MQAFRPLQRYFDFSGRSCRAEFWQFIGLYTVALLLAFAFDYRRELERGSEVPILVLIVILGGFIPGQAVTVRRLHDRGKSARAVILLWAFNILGSALSYLVIQDPYGALVAVFRPVMIAAGGITIICSFYILIQAVQAGDEGRNAYGSVDQFETADRPEPAARHSIVEPAPSTPPARPQSMDEVLGAIERLGKLKGQGLISEDEFAAQKARLLDSAR